MKRSMNTTLDGLTLTRHKQPKTIAKSAKAYHKWHSYAAPLAPHLMLQRALQHPAGLYWSHQTNTPQGIQQALIVTDKRGTMRLFTIDGHTHLLLRTEALLSHDVHGDGIERTEYQYTSKGNPRQYLVQHQKWAWAHRQWRCTWTPAKTSAPHTPQKPHTATSKPSISPIQKVADHLYVLPLHTLNHRVLIIAYSRHLGIIEAPVNEQVGRFIIEQARRRFPHKPIKYLFLTHHHPDHAGGLKPFVDAGATIVTTPGNGRLFQQMTSAPRLLDRSSSGPATRALRLLFVDKKRTFQDKDVPLEVYDIGPETHHTREYLIYYFPKQKIVFEGDLGSLYTHRKYKASKRTEGLYKSIITRKLDVSHIIQSWPRRYTHTMLPFSRLQAAIKSK